MKETHTFLMPDYYPDFACKMGACRSACCEGWPISISMDNYFRLLGMDCPPSLRERLDRGLHLYPHPTPERYACLEPRYDGNCALRLEDGRCALQAEMGEEPLPDICRLYPRGMRIEDGLYECSCANSCEAVLEMFYARREPIRFVYRPQTVQSFPMPERSTFFETLGLEQKIRLHLISILQNRKAPLMLRIEELGQTLDRLDPILERKDKEALDRLLEESPQTCAQVIRPVGREHLQFGLHIAEAMLELIDERSPSVRLSGQEALQFFRSGDEWGNYCRARRAFETHYPDWEIFFEHMLVNHMFFSQFPFQDRPESMHSECAAVCALYAMLRFLSLGCTAQEETPEKLVDVMAAAFRLVDHTSFDRYASHLLEETLSCRTADQLRDLISL